MREIGNAPAGAGTPTGARSELAVGGGGFTSSTLQYTSALADCQDGPVARHLQRGAQNAVTTAELLRLTGYSTPRALQAAIARERAAGALICSVSGRPGGYYISESREELAAFYRTVRSRAISTLRTLRAARQALRVVEGQIMLNGCFSTSEQGESKLKGGAGGVENGTKAGGGEL